MNERQQSDGEIYYKKYGSNFHLDEFFQLSLTPSQTQTQAHSCRLPTLIFTGHQNRETERACRAKADWGWLSGSRWHLNKTLLSFILPRILCEYRNLTRLTDFQLEYSANASLVDGQLIRNEVIEVFCYVRSSERAAHQKLAYENIHVQIVDKLGEIFPPSHRKRNLKDSEDASSCSSAARETDSAGGAKPLNILLLSYDSLSRVSFLKRLPRTSQLVFNQMNFTLLYGQNIMGDGTPACMVPLLTGHAESELPSTLKSDPNGQYVDQVYPFIWNSLHEKGKCWPLRNCSSTTVTVTSYFVIKLLLFWFLRPWAKFLIFFHWVRLFDITYPLLYITKILFRITEFNKK